MTEETSSFEALFRKYPNRNFELRAVAKTLYEYGRTVAKEDSAAHSSGLNAHALRRQREYLANAKALVAAMAARPTPDLPATHPTQFAIDFTTPYTTFTVDVAGNQVPLNEMTQLLSEAWMIAAVELAKSQSASVAGSLVSFDATRAQNNLDVIGKFLDEIEARPMQDLPETAHPDSGYGLVTTTA